MKKLILLILIYYINYGIYSQVDDELLYKNLINDFVLKYKQDDNAVGQAIVLIMLNKPYYLKDLHKDDYARFKMKYKKLDNQTFVDFLNKCQLNLQSKNIVISDVNIIMFNKESIPDRKELHLKYPNWTRSIIEFSNIGYNEARNQALVYYGFDSGPGVGGGIYVIFEKKGSIWKYKKIIPAWAT